MTTQIQRRRGTTVQHSSFTGAEAEITIDTDKETVVVHNGSTAGGFPLLRASGGAQDISTTGDVSAADGTFTGDATLTGDLTINTDAFFVDASETKVGIGTTSPQTITHILGADPILRIQDNSISIADAFAAIQLGESMGANEALGNYWQIAMEGDSGTSSDHLTFKDGTGERMRIDSDGRLLIGSTSTTNNGLLMVKGNPTVSTDQGEISVTRGSSVTGADQNLGFLNFGEGAANTAVIKGVTAANWTSGSDRPTYMTFETTAASSGSPTERMRITSAGHTLPGADDTYDLGSATKRWANIYSADLQLSNEGAANEVDGTWGNYTIQEGEDDLFLINRRNGKTYKFNLTEVA